jgi:uncharacterized protein
VISDPLFYALAVPAVLVTGISKGGFGGGAGSMSVPLMALAVSIPQAAAIMLPILCLMDLLGVWAYRKTWDWANMRILIPAAVVGIAVGAATFHLFNEAAIRLMIGTIAVSFALDYWFGRRPAKETPGPSVLKGGFWGAVAGLTSFAAHAGGPPISVYLLPQRMNKTILVGTTVMLFTVVNYVKLFPYWWLGQLNVGNLTTSLVLLPLAPMGIGLGVWLHKRVSPTWFYRICYFLVFATGVKLLYDGLAVFA